MIDEADRREMLRVDLCGNRVVERLETIGIRRLSDLRGQDAEDLVERVNLAAGAPIWRPPIATRALMNLIDPAERRDG
jgi:hypothetical protein